MKTLLRFSLPALLVLACGKETVTETSNSAELEGSWKLTERLIDPGDGSGTFEAVSEYKVISFDAGGTYQCTGSTCMASSSGGPSNGSYDTTSTTLSPVNCSPSGLNIGYTITDGKLIISYPCFEGCYEKFEKL